MGVAIAGWAGRTSQGLNVWGESDDTSEGWSCTSNVAFSRAEEICTSVGARLCTAQEMRDDVTRGTGCGHDNDQIWTWDVGTIGDTPALAMNLDFETTTDEPTTEEGNPGGNFKASANDSDEGTSSGAIAGAIIGTLGVCLVIIAILYVRNQRTGESRAKMIENGTESAMLPKLNLEMSERRASSTDEVFRLAPDGGSIRLESVQRGNPMYRNSVVQVSNNI